MIQFKTYKRTGSPATVSDFARNEKALSIEQCDTADDELIFGFILAAQVNIEARFLSRSQQRSTLAALTVTLCKRAVPCSFQWAKRYPMRLQSQPQTANEMPEDQYSVDTF